MNLLDQLKSDVPYSGNRSQELGLAIIVGGYGSSGSSTIAKMLADYFHLEYNYAGGKMREIGRLHGFEYIEEFLSSEDFTHNHSEYDLQVERMMLQALSRDDVLLDSKLAAAITTVLKVDVTVKIWLDAPVEIRAKRIFEKNGELYPQNPTMDERKQLEENIKNLDHRFDIDRKRYKLLYDIDYDKPEKYNDIVMITEGMNAEQTLDSVLQEINNGGYIRRFTK